jgi:hypothetical protein
MQRLYKNENLLFKDFQDFLSRKHLSLRIACRTIFAG